MKIIGRQISIGVGKEAVRGTAVTPTYWLPWAEATIETRIERAINEASLGRLEDSDGSAIVTKWGEGTISGKIKDKSFGLLLLSLLGTDTPTTVESGVYAHAFTLAQSTQHQSLTVAVKDANIDECYTNAVIDNLKIDAELGSYVMYEAGFQSKPEVADTNTVSIISENDFVPQMLSFKIADTQAQLTGATAIPIKTFSIELKNNVIREDVLGSVEPNDILGQQFSCEGTITLIHNNTTYEALQNNDTQKALRLELTHTVTIGAVSKPKLMIDLNAVKFFDYERELGQNDLIEETFNFKAYYSITDGKMITATLTNTVATY